MNLRIEKLGVDIINQLEKKFYIQNESIIERIEKASVSEYYQANRESILEYSEGDYCRDIKEGPLIACVSCDGVFFSRSVSKVLRERMLEY